MGADGLSVEKFFNEEGYAANLDVAAASSLRWSAAQRAREMIWRSEIARADGRARSVHLHHATLQYKDYFVVLAMKPEGNLGRARYELRKAELMLAHESRL